MASKKPKKPKDDPSELAITDRRLTEDRRSGIDRRQQAVPVEVQLRKVERRKGERRRQIDPTTCERDYDAEELEFMKAIEDYKHKFRRPFPTWSEVLEVLKSIGYRKVAEPSSIPLSRAKDSREDEDRISELAEEPKSETVT